MEKIIIEFEGIKYNAVEVVDFESGQTLTVAENDLNHALVKDGEYVSTEARYIDETIYFFVSPEQMELPEIQFKNLLPWVN